MGEIRIEDRRQKMRGQDAPQGIFIGTRDTGDDGRQEMRGQDARDTGYVLESRGQDVPQGIPIGTRDTGYAGAGTTEDKRDRITNNEYRIRNNEVRGGAVLTWGGAFDKIQM